MQKSKYSWPRKSDEKDKIGNSPLGLTNHQLTAFIIVVDKTPHVSISNGESKSAKLFLMQHRFEIEKHESKDKWKVFDSSREDRRDFDKCWDQNEI